MTTYRETGITENRFRTIPASNTNRVWSVRGTGKKGSDTQAPRLIRPIKAAE